jgi:hypothetical protein
MSGLFGGSQGKDAPQDVNVPPFLSSGGVTPDQQAFGDFTYGQDLLNQGSMFGDEGLGDSTMATMGAEGAANTEAQTMGEMSDKDQTAQYGLYQNDVNALQTQLQNQVTLNSGTQGNLNDLASLAGFGAKAGGTTPAATS